MAERIDDKRNEEKKRALENAIANIDKQFGKGAVMKLGDNVSMNVDVISTGSLGLDYALGIGGLPKGRIVEIFGPESSGKTTLALHVIAESQKQGGIAAFIDAGNIWTLKDEGQVGGQFKFDQFYKQIALSYGIGLRLNFDYFVIRLDWGIKAFDPSRGDGERWRFVPGWNILKDTALHFAVGYPF